MIGTVLIKCSNIINCNLNSQSSKYNTSIVHELYHNFPIQLALTKSRISVRDLSFMFTHVVIHKVLEFRPCPCTSYDSYFAVIYQYSIEQFWSLAYENPSFPLTSKGFPRKSI